MGSADKAVTTARDEKIGIQGPKVILPSSVVSWSSSGSAKAAGKVADNVIGESGSSELSNAKKVADMSCCRIALVSSDVAIDATNPVLFIVPFCAALY